jgi:hypothetical protein
MKSLEWIVLWPGHPALSILAVWLVSLVVLWAARAPMLELLSGLGRHLEEGLAALARACRSLAAELRKRNQAALLASGELELRHKLERELQRIDRGFSDRLGQYSSLQRRLDDLVQQLDADYRKCGDVPPEVPAWTAAVEAISALPANGDRNVEKIMESIRKSLHDAQKKALQAHRDDSSRRHRILGGMLPSLRDVKGLLSRMRDCVDKALETTTRVNGYVDEYGRIRDGSKQAARALAHSSVKLFLVSLAVLAIALGGAFVNFQLIALPMSELVPAGARIGGTPVATVSALILVLMEAAVGIFLMDALGFTELFPKLSRVPESRRRMILWLAAFGLFCLAAVESSLAVLREQIAEADAALKLSLAGTQEALIVEASDSSIPVVGQAVLGFALPWVLATVAIPLEMLLDSGRHVLASLAALLVGGLGQLASALEQAVRAVFHVLPSAYDVYVAIPLRLEGWLRRRDPATQRAPIRSVA